MKTGTFNDAEVFQRCKFNGIICEKIGSNFKLGFYEYQDDPKHFLDTSYTTNCAEDAVYASCQMRKYGEEWMNRILKASAFQ